jgi:hypothetical protein
MSLTEQFARASKHSGADEARVRRVLAGLKFLGLPGTSLWSGDGKAAKPLFLKETGRLEALSLTSIQADVRGLATRLRAHSTFQANLVASADVFEPRSGLTSGLFKGGLFLLPDDQDEGEDNAPMPEEAIKVLLDLHALPLLCRLLDFKEGCPKTSAQLLGLADLLLPDPEVQRGLVREFASKLWPGGDEADPTKLGAQEQEALLLEAVLWRLAALKAAICDHKVMGADFELLPFTAPKRPAAAPAGFLDASWGDLPNLIADQTTVRKRQTNEQEDEAEQPSHKRRSDAEGKHPRPPSQERLEQEEEETGSSSSSSSSSSSPKDGYKSPPRASMRKPQESGPPRPPQETPEEVRQRSRGVGGGGFGDPYDPQGFYAELETDLTKEPGPCQPGVSYQKGRAQLLTVIAFAAMQDNKFYAPPLKGKQEGAFDLPKLWRDPTLRLVRHSWYVRDNNKNFRASCQSLGSFFETLAALIQNLTELAKRVEHLAKEKDESGKPKQGYLAGRAVEEVGRITSFISVLNRLHSHYKNEQQLMAYAASALYLHFASGLPAWLEQPNHQLWDRLTPQVGLHCTTCYSFGHLSGGHKKVLAYCASTGTAVMDARQFPPEVVATLPPSKKDGHEQRERQASPYRSRSPPGRFYPQQHHYQGGRDRGEGGGYHGGGGRDRREGGRERGDNREGYRPGNRYAPPGQQPRLGGRGRHGGDRNGQRSR